MYRLQHYLTSKLLEQVYYNIASPYLQCAITSWEKALAIYINKAQIQQNQITEFVSCPKPIKKSNTLPCISN